VHCILSLATPVFLASRAPYILALIPSFALELHSRYLSPILNPPMSSKVVITKLVITTLEDIDYHGPVSAEQVLTSPMNVAFQKDEYRILQHCKRIWRVLW
jgi:hypothetical protein